MLPFAKQLMVGFLKWFKMPREKTPFALSLEPEEAR